MRVLKIFFVMVMLGVVGYCFFVGIAITAAILAIIEKIGLVGFLFAVIFVFCLVSLPGDISKGAKVKRHKANLLKGGVMPRVEKSVHQAALSEIAREKPNIKLPRRDTY